MLQFLAGACLGAGLALLYAPTTGRNARARLKDQATKAQHKLECMGDVIDSKKRHLANKMQGYGHEFSEMKEEVSGQLETIKEDLNEMKEDVSAKMGEVKENVSSKMSEVKENVSGTVTRLKGKAGEVVSDFRPNKDRENLPGQHKPSSGGATGTYGTGGDSTSFSP